MRIKQSKYPGQLGCDLDNTGESKSGKSRNIKIRKKERIMAVMIGWKKKEMERIWKVTTSRWSWW